MFVAGQDRGKARRDKTMRSKARQGKARDGSAQSGWVWADVGPWQLEMLVRRNLEGNDVMTATARTTALMVGSTTYRTVRYQLKGSVFRASGNLTCGHANEYQPREIYKGINKYIVKGLEKAEQVQV